MANEKQAAHTPVETTAQRLKRLRDEQAALVKEVAGETEGAKNIIFILRHALLHTSKKLAAMQGNDKAMGVKAVGKDVIARIGGGVENDGTATGAFATFLDGVEAGVEKLLATVQATPAEKKK